MFNTAAEAQRFADRGEREARRLLSRLDPAQRSFSAPKIRRPASPALALALMFAAGVLAGGGVMAIAARLIFLQTGDFQ